MRYYENIRLISSTRIKDIQLIFYTTSSKVVFDVLEKKVNDINREVALLQVLRNIILKFVDQIKRVDLNTDADVKRLYERAAKVEKVIYGAQDFLWFEEDMKQSGFGLEDWVTAEETSPYDLIKFRGIICHYHIGKRR